VRVRARARVRVRVRVRARVRVRVGVTPTCLRNLASAMLIWLERLRSRSITW